MKNPKQIYSAEQLYEKAWNEPYYYSANNTIMVHIRNFRKKFDKNLYQKLNSHCRENENEKFRK